MATLGPDPARQPNHGGAGAVLLGGAALAAIAWYLETHKGVATGSTCGVCATGCPSVPEGLYSICADPAIPNTCTIWYVKGCQRWGITTPTQLARCFGPNPVVHGPNSVNFGNGDSTSFIGTVGDVSAGCACPNL